MVCPNTIDYSGIGMDVDSCLPQDTLAKFRYSEERQAAGECMKGFLTKTCTAWPSIQIGRTKPKFVEEQELKASTRWTKYLISQLDFQRGKILYLRSSSLLEALGDAHTMAYKVRQVMNAFARTAMELFSCRLVKWLH